jgi:catechol 2,3-dioxygenase-like lactoylglutathione lyase family enzyme
MRDWYVRPVFFVKDAEKSLAFYTETLGFKVDWNHQENGRAYVCQVSRDGFELIFTEDATRAGHGRVFISLNHAQVKALREEIQERSIEARDATWGMAIIEIKDLDGNELFVSLP